MYDTMDSKQISNVNRGKLILYSMSNNITIHSSYFLHKEIHKQTWISSDGHTKKQIDYIVVDEQLKQNIRDVKSYR